LFGIDRFHFDVIAVENAEEGHPFPDGLEIKKWLTHTPFSYALSEEGWSKSRGFGDNCEGERLYNRRTVESHTASF
jgi:hypothetical protein